MNEFLWRNQILLKDWDDFVGPLTERVRRSGEQLAAKTPSGRVHYLSTTRISKEESVQNLLRTQPERDGWVAVLSCVEPCRSFGIRKDAGLKKLRWHLSERQCLHHYFYFRHPELGLLHVRLQTWFPFTMHVCLNGREWLSRVRDGLCFRRRTLRVRCLDVRPTIARTSQRRPNAEVLLARNRDRRDTETPDSENPATFTI